MPERTHIRLTSQLLDATAYAIRQEHITLLNKFLDDDTNKPIYFYDIDNLHIDYIAEVFGCYEVMFSNTYSITTDYRTEAYEIYIIHIEDFFTLLRDYVKNNMETYIEDDDLYNYYTPYIEDYAYDITSGNDAECPICYLIYPDVITFKCGHSVCFDCKQLLLQTKSSVCPICRNNIAPNSLLVEEFYAYLNSDNFNEPDLLDMLDIDRYTTDQIENDNLNIYEAYDVAYTEIENAHYELFISNNF